MNKNITVGFWVSYSLPKKITPRLELYFATACMYDVNFFAFSTKDIDIANKTINGTFWEKGQFVKKNTPMPALFDFRLGNNLDRKFPDVYNVLKQSGYQVSRRGIGDKSDNAKWLLKGSYADYAIETQDYVNCSVKHLLSKHNAIILKPRSGSNGEGIYKIKQESADTVLINYLDEQREDKLENFIIQNHAMFKEREYIAQAYVNSTTLDGSPMDIRLNLARGKSGEWGISVMYFRLGGSSYIGTNMGKEQKSHSIAVSKSLSYQLGEQEGQRVYEELKNFAKDFPEYFQKKIEFIIPELALDIGIDRNNGNKLKIFEIGISPGATAVNILEVPSMNVQFYKYLIDTELYKSGSI